MDKDFTVAIVGYGGMGSWHVDRIAEIDGITLAGVYDTDPKRHELAQENGIHTYESYEALLADETVDLVTVATPNDLHLPIVLSSLNAKKNVVCEKPVAMDSGELKKMIQCAVENECLFSVHQNRRWDEDYLVAKKIYDDNTLGKVFNIESRVHGSRGIPGDWRKKKAHGGGMVLDWGVHLIDQMINMVPNKKVKSLYAQLSYVTCGEVDDGFRLTMDFEDGPHCLIEVGTSNFISQNRWYMQGPNGTAVIRNWEQEGEIVMVSDWEKRDAIPVVTAAGLTKTMAPRTKDTIDTYPLPTLSSDILDYYKNIKEAVDDPDKLLVKPEECMRVMNIMEKVFESAEKNQVLFDIE